MGLSSSETAQCRYATQPGVAFADMTNTFSTTGEVSHLQLLTDLTNGTSYTYYVRCRDADGNVNADDYLIQFSVAAATDVCSLTDYWRCNNATDCTAQAGLYWWENACRTIAEPTDWSGDTVIENGDFTAWTNGFPDAWDIPYTGGARVTEDFGKVLLSTDGSIWSAVRQTYGSAGDGKTYRFVANITYLTDQAEIYTWNNGSFMFTEPGTVTGIITTEDENVWLYLQAHSGAVRSVIWDDVVVKQIAAAPDAACADHVGLDAESAVDGLVGDLHQRDRACDNSDAATSADAGPGFDRVAGHDANSTQVDAPGCGSCGASSPNSRAQWLMLLGLLALHCRRRGYGLSDHKRPAALGRVYRGTFGTSLFS
jgi:hypothetical protein